MDDAEFLARCDTLWRGIADLDALARQRGDASRGGVYQNLAVALEACELFMSTMICTPEYRAERERSAPAQS